jgi:hypothetical protein
MAKSIKGSVDFLEPEFLHSLGVAVATFAHLEAMLMNAFFAAKHQSQDYAAYPESVMEVYEAHFSSKIDKVFAALGARTKVPEAQGVTDLKAEFHETRKARNFIVHGVWRPGDKEGCVTNASTGTCSPAIVTLAG